MFHIVLSIASRFMFFGNMLQGLARSILALRNLGVISHLIPTLSPPPPILLLDAAAPFVELTEETFLPYPFPDPIDIGLFERRTPAFSSSIPSYQSSLVSVTPSHLPTFVPLLITLAIISVLVFLLPTLVYFFMKIAKMPSTVSKASSFLPARPPLRFTSRSLVSLVSLLLLWTGPPAVASFFTFIWIMSIFLSQEHGANVIVIFLQWCGLLAVQDTRTPPLLDAMYEQINRVAAGYMELVGCSNLPHDHHEDPYTQFIASQNILHEQLELSQAREQKLHAKLLVAEQEHESLKELIPTLKESNKKQRVWEIIATNARACHAKTESTMTSLREDLEVALDWVREVREQLDCQTLLLSSKDRAIQSITEESQVSNVRLKNAEDKIARLTTKLQYARDLRHRKMQQLLSEQARDRERYESELSALRDELEKLRPLLDRRDAYYAAYTDSMLREWSMALKSPEPFPPEQLKMFHLPSPRPLLDMKDAYTDSMLQEWSMALKSPEPFPREHLTWFNLPSPRPLLDMKDADTDSMLREWSVALKSPESFPREHSNMFRLPSPPPTKADGKLRRGHRPGPSPPRNRIPKLDYGLPEDFVPSFGGLSPATEFSDFGCIIPLDCPTSTPTASRKRALKEGLLDSDTSPAALSFRSFTDLSPPVVGRGLLPSLDIFA